MSVIYALAQAVAAAQPEAAAQQGVTSYAPAFFAAQQPNTALDMLRRVPGFSVDVGDSVRGFEGAAGNVLIDGQRPSSKADNVEDILLRISASSVARIDIIRGGAPGIDMQGKTVLANVIRKSDGGVRATVQVSEWRQHDGRDLGNVRLEASGGGSGRTWELGVRGGRGVDDGAGRGPGVRIPAGGPPQPYEIDGEGDGHNITATAVGESPFAGGQVRLNGRFFANKFKFDEVATFLPPAPGVESEIFHDENVETELGGRFTRAFGATNLELLALRQTKNNDVADWFDDNGTVSFFRGENDLTETILRGVAKRKLNERLQFELGAETARNVLDADSRLAVDGAPIALPAGMVRVKENRSEVFGKVSWRPTAQWTVDGGLRHETSTISSSGDVSGKNSLKYLKPRLAVTWAPSAERQVRLRFEREVDQLDFDDFVAEANFNTTGVSAGNPDIIPAQAWVGEAAFEQRFWGRGSVTLTFSHSEISDVIDRGLVPGTSIDRPTNIGSATEDIVRIDLTLPLDRLGAPRSQIKGNYARVRTRVTDPTTGEKREISGQDPDDWDVSFTQDIPAWKITWGVDLFGSFRESYYQPDLIEDFKLSTYVRPYVEWKPRTDLNVRFEVTNATQRGLRDLIYSFPAPRNQPSQPDVQFRDIDRTPVGFRFQVRKTFGG